MTIKEGDFVKISYTAKLEDGTVIDSTDESVAKEAGVYEEHARYGDIVIVVGEGHVLKGLEEDIIGKEVGYKGTVEVPPEKAFGEYDPNKKEMVTLKKFKEKPKPGDRVRIGDKVGVVEKVVGRRAIVDFNHPLAGKKIIFEYEIKEKIDDPAEKVKALLLIHTGRDLEARVEDGKAVIEVPRDVAFNQFFILGKMAAVNKIFEHVPEVKEVEFVERYVKEAKEESS